MYIFLHRRVYRYVLLTFKNKFPATFMHAFQKLKNCAGFFFFFIVLGLRCSAWASLVVPCELSCPTSDGILVPQSGIALMVLALESGFFTTGPPRKSPEIFLTFLLVVIVYVGFYLFLSALITLAKALC